MKTMTTALMVLVGSVMLADGADAAKLLTRVELHPTRRPIAPFAPISPVSPIFSGSTGGAIDTMIIEMLPATQIASGFATVQFVVRPPFQSASTHLAQLTMNGAPLGQRSILPGSSAILAGGVPADGQTHSLLVSVYRLQSSGRMLVAQRSFDVMFPRTAP
jgi:hypothetical protein